MKLVSIPPKKKEPAYEPSMPDAEALKSLLLGKKMESCICIVVNEDGAVSHYIDNLNQYEAVGLLETSKVSMALSSLEEV